MAVRKKALVTKKCKNCDNQAEDNGGHCTKCRLQLAEMTRVSYNVWKKSRGLPVETEEEEMARILLEK